MKIKNLTATLLVFLINLLVFAQEKDYVANQIIVKLKNQHSFSLESDKATFGINKLDVLNQEHQLKAAKSLHKATSNRSFVLEFKDDKDIAEVIKEYERSGLFEYVEHNYIMHATGLNTVTVQNPPNDTFYGRQWALKNDGTFSSGHVTSVAGADISMEPAWAIEKGNSSILVAVIDTGINFLHPEFDGRLWQNPNEEEDDGYEFDLWGWNFINDTNEVFDDQGHGTSVAGVIAAKPDNGLGFAGVDWHCQIMTIKALSSEGSGATTGIIEGVYYAVDRGANIINMSLGGGDYSLAFEDAIDYATQNGVTVIAAMGNENVSHVTYPAGYQDVIAVGSTDSNDERSNAFHGNPNNGGSNYGGHIDVVAPGGDIFILDYSNEYNFNLMSSGTSLSSPYVAGLASLLLAQDPTRTPADIKQIIRSTADDEVGRNFEDTQGFDIYHGYGRINAHTALQAYLSVADNEKSEVVIYPNPATDYFSIQNNSFTKLEVFSITGKLLLSKSIGSESEITQSVSDWNSGIYILRLQNEKGQSSVEKLIVR